jgi:hypothetical protein
MKFFTDELSPIHWSVLNHSLGRHQEIFYLLDKYLVFFLAHSIMVVTSPSEMNLHKNLQMMHRVRKLVAIVLMAISLPSLANLYMWFFTCAFHACGDLDHPHVVHFNVLTFFCCSNNFLLTLHTQRWSFLVAAEIYFHWLKTNYT